MGTESPVHNKKTALKQAELYVQLAMLNDGFLRTMAGTVR